LSFCSLLLLRKVTPQKTAIRLARRGSSLRAGYGNTRGLVKRTSSRSSCCRPFGLQPAANCFYLAKNAQQIAAEDLVNLLAGVAAIQKRLRDFGQIGDRINSLR